jgi:hypothetical protein
LKYGGFCFSVNYSRAFSADCGVGLDLPEVVEVINEPSVYHFGYIALAFSFALANSCSVNTLRFNSHPIGSGIVVFAQPDAFLQTLVPLHISRILLFCQSKILADSDRIRKPT